MGDQVVYSFKDTGILLYERGFYLVPGRTQWDSGTIKSQFRYQAVASGPTKVDDLAQTLFNMYQNNIKPFLVVQFPDDSLREKYFKTAWTDYDTGGQDWHAMYLDGTIAKDVIDPVTNKVVTKSADYICMGDTVAYETDINSGRSLAGKKFLFAHKNIVASITSTPGQTWKHPEQTFFYADVNRGTADEKFMYASIGHNVVDAGTAPAVLKCFLQYFKTSNVVQTLIEDNWDVKITSNTLGPKGVLHLSNCIQTNEPEKHYIVYNSVQGALLNLSQCVLREATIENNTFQGFYVEDTALLNEDRARKLMVPLCNSDLPDPIVPDYPKLCACLGRKGVEDALRRTLMNDKVRMVCQSSDCLDGQRNGGVYTFTPSPPCAPINICLQTVNVDAARVKLENVNLTCNIGDAPPPLPGLPGLPPLASLPGLSLPGLSPPGTESSNTTTALGITGGSTVGGGGSTAGTYAGIAIGVLLFVVLIIVGVVFGVRRARRAKTEAATKGP
jgi:hypothetical protein